MSDDLELIRVPLPDLLRVRKLLEELVSFFHQPLHFQDVASVQSFLEQGTYAELSELFYKVTYDWLPAEIKVQMDEL